MAIFGWFRKDEADFERVLDELDRSIQQRESELEQLHFDKDRISSRFTWYSTILYIIYAILYYLQVGPLDRSRVFDDNDDQARKHLTRVRLRTTTALVFVPFLILVTRKCILWVFDHRQRHQEGVLKSLRAKQKAEVERLKKKTKYDETRELLERYSNNENRRSSDVFRVPNSPNASMRPSPSTPSHLSTRARIGPRHSQPPAPLSHGANSSLAPQQSTPVKFPQQQQQHQAQSQAQNQAQGPKDQHSQHLQQPSSIPHSSSRGLVEKLTDALLGENEQSPNSKYALICKNCFAHNGLVLAEEMYTIQYKCPKCGYFNPAKNPKQPPAYSDMAEAPGSAMSIDDKSFSTNAPGSPTPASYPRNTAQQQGPRHSLPANMHRTMSSYGVPETVPHTRSALSTRADISSDQSLNRTSSSNSSAEEDDDDDEEEFDSVLQNDQDDYDGLDEDESMNGNYPQNVDQDDSFASDASVPRQRESVRRRTHLADDSINMQED